MIDNYNILKNSLLFIGELKINEFEGYYFLINENDKIKIVINLSDSNRLVNFYIRQKKFFCEVTFSIEMIGDVEFMKKEILYHIKNLENKNLNYQHEKRTNTRRG